MVISGRSSPSAVSSVSLLMPLQVVSTPRMRSSASLELSPLSSSVVTIAIWRGHHPWVEVGTITTMSITANPIAMALSACAIPMVASSSSPSSVMGRSSSTPWSTSCGVERSDTISWRMSKGYATALRLIATHRERITNSAVLATAVAMPSSYATTVPMATFLASRIQQVVSFVFGMRIGVTLTTSHALAMLAKTIRRYGNTAMLITTRDYSAG